MPKKFVFFSFVFSFLLLLPFLIDQNVIRGNDLNGNLTPITFFAETLKTEKSVPAWNFYINQGIPQVADPLFSFYNPLVSISFLLFPLDISVKIIYFLCLFLAIIFTYKLMIFFKLTKNTAFILSLTYSSGAYLASRITAGHFEKILTFPLLPLFLLILFLHIEQSSAKRILICSAVLSLMFFSGDLYSVLYSISAIFVLSSYYLAKNNFQKFVRLLAVLPFFLLISSVKLLPFLELIPYLHKNKEPLSGSHNVISLVYNLFLPFKPIYLLGTETFLNVGFAWWEKMAFVGPLFLILLVVYMSRYKRIFHPLKNEITILFTLFFLFAIPSFPLNPLKLAINNFDFLQFFHAPGRVFAYLTIIILIIGGITLEKFKIRKKNILLLLILNLFFVILLFEFILIKKQFPLINSDLRKLTQELKQDNMNYYIAGFVSESQFDQPNLVLAKQKNLQANYGLQLKNSPAVKFTEFDFNLVPYNDIAPKFIVSDINSKIKLPENYKIYKKNNTAVAYLNNKYTPLVYSDTGNLVNFKIGMDTIFVKVTSNKPGYLTIAESNYPGWSVYINDRPGTLQQNRFLKVPLINGTNEYFFKYQSGLFTYGAIITLASLVILFVLLGNNKLKKKIKRNINIYKLEMKEEGLLKTVDNRIKRAKDIFFCNYYKFFKSRNFILNNNSYTYQFSLYGDTWKNERAVEIPIIYDAVKKNKGKTLEIGNVLSNYFDINHDVLDKYEKGEQIINKDALTFKTKTKYDLVVSISTIEHIGWDMGEKKEKTKIEKTLKNVSQLISKNGRILMTFPVGYNPYLDKLLVKRKKSFSNLWYLKRISSDNKWQEVSWNDIAGLSYTHEEKGLVVAEIRKGFL